MRRRLLNVVAALSLLLCAATVVWWVRSYRLWEWTAYQRTSGRVFIITSRLGALDFGVTDGWPAGQFATFERHSNPVLVPSLPPPSEWHLLGFGLNRRAQNIGVGNWTGPSSGTAIIIPYWFLTVLTMIPALMIGFGRLRRTRRRWLGRCPCCGYDLRATPDRCPECGVEAKPHAAEGIER